MHNPGHCISAWEQDLAVPWVHKEWVMFLTHPSIPACGLLIGKVCIPGQPGWVGGTGGLSSQVHCGKLLAMEKSTLRSG